jgi:hypothetical protein
MDLFVPSSVSVTDFGVVAWPADSFMVMTSGRDRRLGFGPGSGGGLGDAN